MVDLDVRAKRENRTEEFRKVTPVLFGVIDCCDSFKNSCILESAFAEIYADICYTGAWSRQEKVVLGMDSHCDDRIGRVHHDVSRACKLERYSLLLRSWFSALVSWSGQCPTTKMRAHG